MQLASQRSAYWLMAAALLIFGLLIAATTSRAPHFSAAVPVPVSDDGVSQPMPSEPASLRPYPHYETGLEQLPDSFAGTRLEIPWQVDGRGHLVVDRDVRAIFDYFLAGLGEESLASLLARIRAYINYTLSQPAAGEAQALLENYIALLTVLSEWQQATSADLQPDTVVIAERLNGLRDVRIAHLGLTVAEAFYGEEDRYDQYTLEQLAVLQDEKLDEQQIADQLQLLLEELPEGLRHSVEQADQAVKLGRLTALLQAAGGDEQDLYQLRASVAGDAAATRLAELDRQRANWQRRMDTWLGEREQILGNNGLDEGDRQQLLQQRRMEHFNPIEIQRVITLESIRASQY